MRIKKFLNSFMNIFNKATDVVKFRGEKDRELIWGILLYDHSDVKVIDWAK
ncbi:MAG: hypothetical protein ACMUJM_14105 [bacterium]